MWVSLVSHWLLAASLLSQAAGSAPALPELIPTRQTRFAIPFRVEASDDPARQAVEVELHVSSDRGGHWRFYQRQPAGGQQFVFRADVDGEYWFAIRTINRAGQAVPDTITAPGLRVLVDTKPPSLKLTAQPAPAGQVSLRWELDERNPKPNSLRLAYRRANTEVWRPVNAAPQSVSRAGSRELGYVLFHPDVPLAKPVPPAIDIECRGDVSDTAGNRTVAYALAKLRPVEPAEREQSFGGRVPLARPAPTDLPRAKPAPLDTRVPLAKPVPLDAAKPVPPDAAQPKGSVAIAINLPLGTKYTAPSGVPLAKQPRPNGVPPAKPVPPAAPDVPPGEHPRMVNTRLFELEYDLDSVGPSGIGRIELWGTTDGGKSWRRFPVGTDKPKVLTVSVEGEGVYGFRMVVTNGAGLGGRRPAAGDLPDIWIGVDLTKPTAQIVSAQQGVNSEAQSLIISWQADDKMLAARPVSLLFRQDPREPWVPLASGLENTGRYAWPIDSRTPPQIYLRLEVRDEAGNVGVHELSESVSIDQSRPTARIRDVRPLDEAHAPGT